MRLQDIIAALEDIAPPRLAEPWDKVGLHLGDPNQRVRRVLLCIDLTEAVVDEAVDLGANLIVAYHPPVFRPLERLVARSWKERALLHAIRRDVAIYSPHTALDAAVGGLGDWLCQGLGAGDSKAITDRARRPEQHRVIALVEAAQAERVANILLGALDRGQPVLTSEAVATVRETARGKRSDALTRLEVLTSTRELAEIRRQLAGLRVGDQAPVKSLDVVGREPLATPQPPQGSGRIHTLHAPISPSTLVRRLKGLLRRKTLELAAPGSGALTPNGPAPGKIQRVAVCPGAGGGLFESLRPERVDAYVTGEMRHHDVLAAVQRGQVVVLAGHTQTERPYLPTYRSRIVAALRARGPKRATGRRKLAVEVRVSKADRAPSRVV